MVLLEINENKDNVEIIHWHYLRDEALKTLERQAAREGGRLLILPSEEEAGGLSSRTSNLSFDGKGTEVSDTKQGKEEKMLKTRFLQKKEGKAVGALHHKDVGDIDIWYGDDKAGLKKIGMEKKQTTGCCLLMKRKTLLAVGLTSFQNPKASRMAQLLCKMNFLMAKVQKFLIQNKEKKEKILKIRFLQENGTVIIIPLSPTLIAVRRQFRI